MQYDPSRLMDSVRDRIKAEFVGLIPEDAWKEMVKAEVDKFFEMQHDNGYGNRTALPSAFRRVVWEELGTATKAKMKEFLASEEWTGKWDPQGNGNLLASEAVRKLVAEKSGEILANVLGGAIQGVIQNMRDRL